MPSWQRTLWAVSTAYSLSTLARDLSCGSVSCSIRHDRRPGRYNVWKHAACAFRCGAPLPSDAACLALPSLGIQAPEQPPSLVANCGWIHLSSRCPAAFLRSGKTSLPQAAGRSASRPASPPGAHAPVSGTAQGARSSRPGHGGEATGRRRCTAAGALGPPAPPWFRNLLCLGQRQLLVEAQQHHQRCAHR